MEFNSLEDFLKEFDKSNQENKEQEKEINTNNINNENDNDIDDNQICFTENDDDQKNIEEEILRKKKEKENIKELTRIIEQEKEKSRSIFSFNRKKDKNRLTEKITSYRKSTISIKKIQQENLMESENLKIINPFGKNWEDVQKEIKEKSIYRNFQTYEIKNFIAKANDDLRQELITMQIIKRFSQIFKEAEIPLKLRPYEILITSPNSGLIEFIPNTISIDGLKKKIQPENSLNVFFRNFFVSNFEEAQKNFVESLAAYSILQYTLGLKDR